MVYRRLLISAQALMGLIQAWIVKTGKNMGNVRFFYKARPVELPGKEISFAIKCADFLVKRGTFRTGRKCFFRAFIIASVLHKWGIPVTMNVGLRNFNTQTRADGHCWLTLDGMPFAEMDDIKKWFPFQMGCSSSGIRYWVG